MPNGLLLMLALISFLLAGCAGPQPVLYPNTTLKQRDADTVNRDIDACMASADRYVGDGRTSRVAGETAEGGAIGGAGGAAGGAVVGNAGQGAAAGAAFGAASGFVHSLFTSHRHSAAYRRFVDQCLREKGYQPVGWQ